MKCAIVTIATLGKHKRWDAGFYLGKSKKTAEAVAGAEERLERAKEIVEERKHVHEEEVARNAKMLAAGEVRPLDG